MEWRKKKNVLGNFSVSNFEKREDKASVRNRKKLLGGLKRRKEQKVGSKKPQRLQC